MGREKRIEILVPGGWQEAGVLEARKGVRIEHLSGPLDGIATARLKKTHAIAVDVDLGATFDPHQVAESLERNLQLPTTTMNGFGCCCDPISGGIHYPFPCNEVFGGVDCACSGQKQPDYSEWEPGCFVCSKDPSKVYTAKSFRDADSHCAGHVWRVKCEPPPKIKVPDWAKDDPDPVDWDDGFQERERLDGIEDLEPTAPSGQDPLNPWEPPPPPKFPTALTGSGGNGGGKPVPPWFRDSDSPSSPTDKWSPRAKKCYQFKCKNKVGGLNVWKWDKKWCHLAGGIATYDMTIKEKSIYKGDPIVRCMTCPLTCFASEQFPKPAYNCWACDLYV